ncbi:MAG: 23S rRNA (guanosine(2251)-2'-O)-methyltransferase RlmB [Flavobacteriaceae bacterium]|mgnify:FL=1|jgi:23S rRNA (guanosine2251-2'-O)-methyltransferase|nr:23S rRNA (guanosine(2251)-2'-O)-methyltransferase RlmB [Flavobacteriaceae bacterium]MBT4113512.1 23S rRNA (guanosine(2251)-2'-O)-methyltransferase RlmB [Flavobacteriaceae bacterium]MBT4613696.1 23S rRNA (guanosine(2251)-2'-O)-methyltransferase RlmB [Flavobacteriaceae bacterium]MBT5246030.1 23S rRNA (guanosine(2251)-2'-O)-methyltransferase RlmB [Flavobacteriaceae bacterium]MBT5650703.1 23S rRNA (guanosine(2251)-2'-O)-methyltransferase RlmB [Flavobacteriaceae bacterium]|tara:strand:+ start:56 stop:790 length:735 start_codon:yes stop_codon:yes gene_type:complete
MEKGLDIYGIRAVIEAIKSGDKTIDKIFIQIGLTGRLINELEALIRKNKLKSSYVPTQKLDKLSKKNHQGVIARISPIEFYELQEIMEKIEDKKDALILILDQINDVRNFGAIIRTAEVSGVDAIIIQNQSSAPINADTVKTSAGGVFNVPICKVSHIKDAIYHLKSSKISVIATSEKAEKNIYDLSLKKSVAIIMGSEERGISSSVLKLSDEMVKLPIFGKIESLNVSVATGIFLYEVIRQRI